MYIAVPQGEFTPVYAYRASPKLILTLKEKLTVVTSLFPTFKH